MKKLWVMAIAAIVGVSLVTVVGFTVMADDDGRGARSFRARLTGYEETPLAISSPGSGTFRLRLMGESATYTLTYSGLTDVRQAHIHFGARGQTAGIAVWLCGTTTNPGPAGTPVCPASAGTVSGTLTPASVVGPSGQGIDAGEWDEFVAAMRAGFTYANVHTAAFGGGEIRGQISPSG